ncbi:IctB family putative bicarbonate transporter [Pantanalinema sp. GBBB05]|uniref:IctB family putative bicarbonate transporter n=1 Tax=Pantanalinema sp. GBBB05 TaxID=2604139 RepID=UPI001E0E5018|nr:putative bicarbonate transporter, IctB family [Pantanalinema sp. GBBB05]
MSSFWQSLTLSSLAFPQWGSASYLHRPIGMLRHWRQGSWLMQWADEIGTGLVMLVFGLVPFANNALTGVLMAAAGGYWLLLTLSDDVGARQGSLGGNDRRSTGVMTPIHLLVLLYWGIAIVATAMSPIKSAALSGLLKLTLYLCLFVLMARVLRSPRIRNWVLTLYLHVSLVVSVYGLQQWFSGAQALATWVDPESPLSKTTRVFSYLGNPNLLAGYLVPAVIFSVAAVFAWQRWLPKALAITMVLVNVACLVLTFSRGGWIGIVVSLFAMGTLLLHWWSIYLPGFWRRWAMPIVLGSAAAVVILAVLVVDPLRDRVMSIFAGRGDSSNNYRINVWGSVIEMIKDRPVIGIGPGNSVFNKIYPLYQRPKYSALSAYSIYLEALVEAGVIGFTCFLWLLLVTLNLGWSQLQRLRSLGDPQGFWLMAAIASLLGMMGHGLVDTVLYRPEVNTLWWLTIALIASFYRPQSTTLAR